MRSHLDLTPAQWAERIAACRRLGSREIFLQWVGLEGGRPDDWMAPDAVLGQIFDEAARHGMGVHVGLPYDQRWWNVLATPDDEALARYRTSPASRAGLHADRALVRAPQFSRLVSAV